MNEHDPLEMKKQMKAAGMKISLMMALVMSLCLSIIGNLTAKRPEGTPVISIVIGIAVSFVISFVISLIIGLLIPMGKLNDSLCHKLGLEKGRLGTRLFESFVSDVVYTPFITLAMTLFAYNTAMRQSGRNVQISYLPMFLSSLLICFIAGFILIFIFQPLFVRMFIPRRPDNNNP
ncbi:MAG: hypothetical protein K5888_05150 [Lachnospiraceae bacterium]|nr:hypothetical protein [Lachnospiraceae bacterium]